VKFTSLLALGALLLAQYPASPAVAQLVADAYEEVPQLEMDAVVPSSIIQSGSYRVANDVTLHGNQLEFQVDSNHGHYRVRSLPMLMLRIHEIGTLAQAVDHFQRNNQKLAAELRGVMQVGADSWVDILTSPIKTTGSLADQFFTKNVGQTVEEVTELDDPKVRGVPGEAQPVSHPNVYESLVPADPVLASHKRAVAAHLDLDVYSSNSRVQVFLDTLAVARGSGNRQAGQVTVSLPRQPEVDIDKGRIHQEVRGLMGRSTIRQLYQHNAAALEEMGIPEELLHGFLTHHALSPSHKTAITAYLGYLQGVNKRGALLQAAMRSRDEVDALGYVHMARMLAHYQEQGGRIHELVSGGTVLMARVGDNDMLLVLPFDLLNWNSDTDRVFTRLSEFADKKAFDNRDVLLAGNVTKSAARQLERRGFTVREKYLIKE
jgi:hypothetical protein